MYHVEISTKKIESVVCPGDVDGVSLVDESFVQRLYLARNRMPIFENGNFTHERMRKK